MSQPTPLPTGNVSTQLRGIRLELRKQRAGSIHGSLLRITTKGTVRQPAATAAAQAVQKVAARWS